MDITRYKKILDLPMEFKPSGIKQHIPTPTDSDYKRGYIVRYFTQKVNDIDSPVYEINDATFSNLINNSFYQVCNLDWKIIGTDDEIKEANMKSIKRASKTLNAVQLYLPYLLQFKKS
jgi:hypothetical protein